MAKREQNCKPTSVVVVVRVHEGHRHGILPVQGALVGIAAIHGVDHVSHLLPGGSDGIFAFLGQFPVRVVVGREGEEGDQVRCFYKRTSSIYSSQPADRRLVRGVRSNFQSKGKVTLCKALSHFCGIGVCGLPS